MHLAQENMKRISFSVAFPTSAEELMQFRQNETEPEFDESSHKIVGRQRTRRKKEKLFSRTSDSLANSVLKVVNKASILLSPKKKFYNATENVCHCIVCGLKHN